MPTVFEKGRYKFKVHKRDHNPPHFHVEGPGGKQLVVSFDGLVVMERTGFKTKAEIALVLKLIGNRLDDLQEAWREYHED